MSPMQVVQFRFLQGRQTVTKNASRQLEPHQLGPHYVARTKKLQQEQSDLDKTTQTVSEGS